MSLSHEFIEAEIYLDYSQELQRSGGKGSTIGRLWLQNRLLLSARHLGAHAIRLQVR